MKIAVFGDIHGNIEALRTAHAAIEDGLDAIFHLGDLGGYAPFVNEVADFLVEHGIRGVQGNYDDAVANDREHCGCRSEDAVQEPDGGFVVRVDKAARHAEDQRVFGRAPEGDRL